MSCDSLLQVSRTPSIPSDREKKNIECGLFFYSNREVKIRNKTEKDRGEEERWRWWWFYYDFTNIV